MSSSHSTNRTAFMSCLAVIIGLGAGGAAFVLIHSIGLLTNLTLFHRWGWNIPAFDNLHVGPSTYAVAIGGALIVALLAKWSPIIKGHGLPEAMEAILTKQSRIAPRTAIAKPVSAAIAIGTGGPFGAEGPIIVTGGAIGSLLGQLTHVSPNERKILLASGAAAGMAATFGSPLAAVVLAIELLLFEFSTRAFIPLVVATSIAAGVHSALFTSGPLFNVPTHDFAGLAALPLFAVLGVLCGLLAVLINSGLFFIEHLYRRLPVSEFWHPAIGAGLFVTIGLFEPRALGVGYIAIDDVLASRLAVGALIGLGIAKLVAWWVALASGTSGGTLAPMLLISACMGSVIGVGFHDLFPGSNVSVGAFALVAMAATFGAATRATFASIVFLFELTRDYNAILPLMLATVIADLIARRMLHDSIMTEKLTRRGLHVPSDFYVDVLRSRTVNEIMTHTPMVLRGELTTAEAAQRMRDGRHRAYPVVDRNDVCIGLVTRSDLLGVDTDLAKTLAESASTDLVFSRANATVADALELMLDESIEQVPVLDDAHHVVGILTRRDVLAARQQQFALDHRQDGWFGNSRWA